MFITRLGDAAVASMGAGKTSAAAGLLTALILQEEDPNLLEKFIEAILNGFDFLKEAIARDVLKIPSASEALDKLLPDNFAEAVNNVFSKWFVIPEFERTPFGWFLIALAILGFVVLHWNTVLWMWDVAKELRKSGPRAVLAGETDLQSPFVYPFFNYAPVFIIITLILPFTQTLSNLSLRVIRAFIDTAYSAESIGTVTEAVVKVTLLGWSFVTTLAMTPWILFLFWVIYAVWVFRAFMIPLRAGRLVLMVTKHGSEKIAPMVMKDQLWGLGKSFITVVIMALTLAAIPYTLASTPLGLYGTFTVQAMLIWAVIAPWVLFWAGTIPYKAAKGLSRRRQRLPEMGENIEEEVSRWDKAKEAAAVTLTAIAAEVPELRTLQAVNELRKGEVEGTGHSVGGLISRALHPEEEEEENGVATTASPTQSTRYKTIAPDYADVVRTLGVTARGYAPEILAYSVVQSRQQDQPLERLAADAYDKLGKMSDEQVEGWRKIGIELQDFLQEGGIANESN